jgi:hypothetical protein
MDVKEVTHQVLGHIGPKQELLLEMPMEDQDVNHTFLKVAEVVAHTQLLLPQHVLTNVKLITVLHTAQIYTLENHLTQFQLMNNQ